MSAARIAVLIGVWSATTCAPHAADPEAAFRKPDRRLEGTSWSMVTLDGEPVRAALASRQTPVLTFKGGYATWTVGCNGFDAAYRTEGDRLILRPVAGRIIGGCDTTERPIHSALGTEPISFQLQDKQQMILATEDGPLKLRRTAFRPVLLR